MKKVFSANPEATINVECIMNDVDVAGRLSRDVFEEKSASVLERARAPLQKVSHARHIRLSASCTMTNTTHSQLLYSKLEHSQSLVCQAWPAELVPAV